jgi:pimeloyl-ACP methyl ester carboxylesterase
MAIEHKYADVDGIKLHYVEAHSSNKAHFEATKTIVFLHGFPEFWGTWQKQIKEFSVDYRVIVPDLLGYNLSDKPTDDTSYQVPQLITLMSKFLQSLSKDTPVILVAHDWGGAIAWPLVAFHPKLVSRLIILNAAHPSTFTREMISNPQQRLKSAYIHQLIAENAVEDLSKNDYFFFRKMLFEHRLDGGFSELEKQVYLQVWKEPGAIQGMLNYYKSMPQLAPSERASGLIDGPITDTAKMKIPQIMIKVPTLVLWGMQDQAFVPAVLEGIEHYVNDCKIQRFENASHWLHHEQPEQINLAIRRFIE